MGTPSAEANGKNTATGETTSRSATSRSISSARGDLAAPRTGSRGRWLRGRGAGGRRSRHRPGHRVSPRSEQRSSPTATCSDGIGQSVWEHATNLRAVTPRLVAGGTVALQAGDDPPLTRTPGLPASRAPKASYGYCCRRRKPPAASPGARGSFLDPLLPHLLVTVSSGPSVHRPESPGVLPVASIGRGRCGST